jgi:hypothetical protein
MTAAGQRAMKALSFDARLASDLGDTSARLSNSSKGDQKDLRRIVLLHRRLEVFSRETWIFSQSFDYLLVVRNTTRICNSLDHFGSLSL